MEGKMRKWEVRSLVDYVIGQWNTIVCGEGYDYIRGTRKLETNVSEMFKWRNIIVGFSQGMVTMGIYDKKTGEKIFQFTFDPDELCEYELID